jgi:hypothetical protein
METKKKLVLVGKLMPRSGIRIGVWQKGKEYDLLNVQINNTRRALEEAIDSRIAQKLEVNLDNVFNEVFGSPAKKKSEKKSSDISLKNLFMFL